MRGRVGWALPTIHHWITDIFFNLELNSRDLLCYSRCMNETQLIEGRLISPEDIDQGGAGKLPLRLIVIAPSLTGCLFTAEPSIGVRPIFFAIIWIFPLKP
jgi:hypothetical protein